MAKSPSKPEQVEVIDDSEGEQPKSSKKKVTSDKGNTSGEEGDGSEEEEYEIEAILDAKHGAFPGGRMGYLVKWKGYSADHNSWVDHEDAGGATLMIEEYWAKQKKNKKTKGKQPKGRPRKSEGKDGSPDVDEPSSSAKRKKSSSARKSKSSQPEDELMDEDDDEEKPKAKKAKKTLHADKSEEMDVDDVDDLDEGGDQGGEYLPMNTSKFREKSWEKLVQRVDTIEKIDGILKVFFTLNNGDKVVEASRECAKHFPQKLIQFYESNLRWRESEQ